MSVSATGLLVDSEHEHSLVKIFERAFAEYKQSGKSSLINVLIGKSKFREGSISV
jgi:hypothetical protein